MYEHYISNTPTGTIFHINYVYINFTYYCQNLQIREHRHKTVHKYTTKMQTPLITTLYHNL